jgi:benzoate membrane transport protein
VVHAGRGAARLERPARRRLARGGRRLRRLRAPLVLTGFWRPLGRAIAAIPAPLAAAMLAGVLLPLCLAPARAVAELPWQGLPVVLVWGGAVAHRAALGGARGARGRRGGRGRRSRRPGAVGAGPRAVVELTAPAFDLGALVGWRSRSSS